MDGPGGGAPRGPAGPPGGGVFSLEGRPAPGLYLVGWLLSIGGLALLLVGSRADAAVQSAVLLLALVVLGFGLATASGYQVVARSTRPAAAYRGPSPLLAFGVVLSLSLVLAVVLQFLGVDLGVSNPLGFLLGLLVVAGCYVGVVWVFVVRTGAMSWHDMGWPRRVRAAEIAGSIGSAVLVMVPTTFAVLLFGGVVSQLLGGIGAPQVVPEPQTLAETLVVALAAAFVAPVGEELFFRGFALTAWLRDLGPRSALLRSAAFFAFVHILNIESATFEEGLRQAILVLSEIVPVGLVLGWLFLRRGILGSIAGHVAYNGLLLGLTLLVRGSGGI